MLRKKAVPITHDDPSLQALAHKLGVERRLNVRVTYPKRTNACLPAIAISGQRMRVHDISTGGCCLINADSVLGPNVGVEVSLEVTFDNGKEDVRARVVGSVHDRRHIQFLDLNQRRVSQLKNLMLFGIRALSIRPALRSSDFGPSLQAREIWSSLIGDSLVLEDGIHRLAQAEIGGQVFHFFKEALPKDSHGHQVGLENLKALILFLANIGHRSPGVDELLTQLENLYLERRL